MTHEELVYKAFEAARRSGLANNVNDTDLVKRLSEMNDAYLLNLINTF